MIRRKKIRLGLMILLLLALACAGCAAPAPEPEPDNSQPEQPELPQLTLGNFYLAIAGGSGAEDRNTTVGRPMETSSHSCS